MKSKSDWYISNQVGVWNVVNNEGTDAFSINLSENIDYEAIINDYEHLNYIEFRKFVESYWKEWYKNSDLRILKYIKG